MRLKRIAVAVLILALVSISPSIPPSRAQPVPATGFNVVNAQWGTAAAPVEAGSGQQNVPLVVTLQYYFSNAANSIEVALSLPQGFTDTNGLSTATAYSSSNVPSGAALPFTFDLDIGSAVTVGAYTFPMTITWGVTLYSGTSESLVQSAQVTVQLRGKVQLEFSASQPALTPGAVTKVPIVTNNIGTGPASNLTLTFSPSAGSVAGPVVSVLNTPPQVTTVPAGSSVTSDLNIYAPTTSAGSTVTLAVTASYSDAYGNARVVTGSVGLYVTSNAVPVLQISAASLVLTAGGIDNVTLTIANEGPLAMKQIVVGVTVPPTISLVGQFPVTLSNLGSGSSAQVPMPVFVPLTLSGATESLTVTATYTDASGNGGVASQTLGFYVPLLTSSPITVKVPSSNLVPGAVNNVTMVISNGGQQPLRQLVVGVTAPQMISVLGQFPQTIQTLAAGSSVQLSLPLFVSSASSGSPVTLVITVTYTDASGNAGAVTQNLGFFVPTAQNADIELAGYSYNPSLIYPGNTVAVLQASLVNTGTTTAQNINVTVVPTDPVYAISKGSLSAHLGLIPNGQTVPLTFTIGIRNSSAPVNSTLTLAVQYSGGKPLQFTIPFTEQPKANFRVVSVSAPMISTGDGADQVTVTLRNTGQAAAQVATFTLEPSDVFAPSTSGSFTTSMNSGIGTVAPGADANLTVVIQVNSNIQGGSYPLVFHATWTQLGASQPFGQDISLSLPVRASAFQIANSLILSAPFLAVVVIVIVALLVRRRMIRRRAQPKQGG